MQTDALPGKPIHRYRALLLSWRPTMRGRPQRLLIVWALVCFAAVAAAQRPGSARERGSGAFVVEGLGRPTVAVDGLWAFHPGDDPAWAQPGFDDAQWARIETGKTWEEQGYRNLTGFAWYRRHIVLDTGTNAADTDTGWQLELYLPAVESAAEVYWNGRRVGRYGKVPPDPVWYDPILPVGAAIVCPACGRGQIVLGRPESGVLAIRVWAPPHVFFSGPEVGGLITTPEIGNAGAIGDQVSRQSGEWLEGSLYGLGLALVEGIVAVLALLAWLRDRGQWMLFWLALYTAHAVLQLPFNVPGLMNFRWGYGLIAPVVCVEDVSLWFLLLYLLRLWDNRRLVQWTLGMCVVAVIGNFGDGALQLFPWTTWPGHVFLAWDIGLTIPSLMVECWVLVLVTFALRRRLDAARWLLAMAAALVDVVQAASDWGGAGARWTHWRAADLVTRPLFTVAGNVFTPGILADTLLLAAMVYAAWRYERERSARQTRLDEEFRNAQELQHVLVPEKVPQVPGYALTSAYRPAQEVGGDFFQVIPGGRDGAIVVVGDVSGKGLKAAMTVSLIVGALRSLAETTSDPAEILAGLNRRLEGRLKGGFATCVVVRLEADGACTIANAGHPAPFLNERELELPGVLPLGLSAEAEYEEVRVRLRAGDRLTLYTDGLPEARNAAGELFGFARVAELVAANPAAGEMAAAAARFGQDDDVTVLSLCYGGEGGLRAADGLAAIAGSGGLR